MSAFDGMNPYEIAALNTREALTAFWGHPHIDEGYYTPARLEIYRAVADIALTLQKPGRNAIVDVGCGDGEMLKTLQERFRGRAAMEGYDWAPTAIERARRKAPFASFGVADFMAGDLDHLSLAGFDLVLCIEVLEHVQDTEKALDILCSLARHDGYVLLTVPNGAWDTWHGHVHRWTMDELRELLAGQGLVRMGAFGGDGYLAAILRRGA